MIKTIASLFALYGLSSSQNAPQIPAVRSVRIPVLIPVEPAIANPANPPVANPPVANPAIPNPAIPVIPVIPVVPDIPIDPQNQPSNPTTQPPIATLVALPEGHMYGAFGQICPIPPIDAQCKTITDFAVGSDFVKCEKDYECCLCSTVQCTNCNTFSVGNSGIYGVKSVLISGIDIEAGGSFIFCKGTEACTNSFIEASNIRGVECSGSMGCQGATITIINPANHFYLDCVGLASCKDLNIRIVIPSTGYCDTSVTLDSFKISKIGCVGQASCEGLEFAITNEGCKQVEIENLDCLTHDACTGASFSFIGEVDIGTCQCGESCASVTGIEKCFDNLEYLFCPDPLSCHGAVYTVVNPVDYFILKCSASNSCQGATFTIVLNDFGPNVDMFDGIMCNGPSACNGATFIIDNQQSIGTLTIDKIECSSIASCMDTTFIIGENVVITQIYCNPGSCDRCVIITDPNVAGMPCDPDSQVQSLAEVPQSPGIPDPAIPVVPAVPDPAVPVVPDPAIPAVPAVPLIPVVPDPAIPVVPAVPASLIPV